MLNLIYNKKISLKTQGFKAFPTQNNSEINYFVPSGAEGNRNYRPHILKNKPVTDLKSFLDFV